MSLQLHQFADYEQLSTDVSHRVYAAMKGKLQAGQKFVLGMATGSTPIRLYAILLDLLKANPLDLSQLYTVNLDEYYPIARTHDESYFHFMTVHFWRPVSALNLGFNPDTQGLLPNGEAPDATEESTGYEQKIRALGGVDLQILGIGTNGHIGFNEPGSAGDSRTRKVELSETTRQDNSRFFDFDLDLVPKYAISMGIGTILEAKQVFILASGSTKKEIISKLRSITEPTLDIPASFAVNHPNAHLFADEGALE